ncbi:hypothetical protein Tco_1165214 [Tanacetum coccineum]
MSNDYRKKVRNVFLGSFGKGQPLSIGKQIEESPEKINRWFTAIRFVHDSKGSEFGTTKWIKPRDVNLKILEDITKELGERRNRIFFTKTSELFFCKLASLNTDRIFSTHGERNKNVSLTFWIIEHYAENLSKIKEDGCDLIITLTEEDSLVLEKGYSQKDEKQGQKRQNQALEMEKWKWGEAKSKPKSQPNQKVNRIVKQSKLKSTLTKLESTPRN